MLSATIVACLAGSFLDAGSTVRDPHQCVIIGGHPKNTTDRLPFAPDRSLDQDRVKPGPLQLGLDQVFWVFVVHRRRSSSPPSGIIRGDCPVILGRLRPPPVASITNGTRISIPFGSDVRVVLLPVMTSLWSRRSGWSLGRGSSLRPRVGLVPIGPSVLEFQAVQVPAVKKRQFIDFVALPGGGFCQLSVEDFWRGKIQTPSCYKKHLYCDTNIERHIV